MTKQCLQGGNVRINDGVPVNIENHIARPPEGEKEICDICNGTGVIQKWEQLEECILRGFFISNDDVKKAEEELEKFNETNCLNCDENGMVED